MSKIYNLTIAEVTTSDGDESDVRCLASTFGDIDIIAYVTRKFDFAEDKEYSVAFSETNSVAGETVRRILTVTADSEIVWTMLTKKISKERKDAAPVTEPGTTPDNGNGVAVDNATIRAWAKEAGIAHSAQGRLAASVVKAYNDAHREPAEVIG